MKFWTIWLLRAVHNAKDKQRKPVSRSKTSIFPCQGALWRKYYRTGPKIASCLTRLACLRLWNTCLNPKGFLRTARAVWRNGRCIGTLDDSSRRRLWRRARGAWRSGAAVAGRPAAGSACGGACFVSRDLSLGFGVRGSPVPGAVHKKRATVLCYCTLTDWNSCVVVTFGWMSQIRGCHDHVRLV